MKAAAVAALILVAAGSLRIVSTYRVFNHTIDEPDHLAAGMEWLTTGKYWYEDQHPPLARVFGALGPFLSGERFREGPDAPREGYRILGKGAHYDRVLALGRAGILPFFWIACGVVGLWAWRSGGAAAAVLAVSIFSTLPPVLAHAGLITTDMALAAFSGSAALATVYWSERPDRLRSVLLGAAVGLACLSKLSALLFLPAFWLVELRRREFRAALLRIRAVAVVAAVAFLVVWAGYRFSFARWHPAPRFFSGMAAAWAHNRTGHPAYIWGHRATSGVWYYYPATLAIKTPLALLLMAAAGVWLVRRREALTPLWFAGTVLVCAMAGRLDLGVRQILPVYIGLSVFAGCAVAQSRLVWQKIATGLLLAWQLVSGAWQHPDYLAYTNEIAGNHPERFVADSDLDWGQDMKRLGTFLREAGASEVTFRPFHRTYVLDVPMLPGEIEHPSTGWNAVSVTEWKLFGFPEWADRATPQKRIGRSILLWYVPPG
jgi:hypothetical protein